MKLKHFCYRSVLLALIISFLSLSCGGGDDDDNDVSTPTDDDNASGDDDDNNNDDNNDDNDTTDWVPVDPHREQQGRFSIVWLAGTPYEMGKQHGELLHEELAAGYDWLNQFHLVEIFLPIARMLGLVDIARDNSYPDILDECQGLVDAAGDVGWEMDLCLLLNFGDMLVEFLGEGFPPARGLAPGCSQAVATDAATVDGRLYHARGLDWSKIDFLLDYPVIFVRQPDDGIPHAFIGFPGNISPYSGINAAGLSVASDEADPLDNTQHDRVGRSHVQMQAQLLKHAHSLEEAKEFILGEDHMTVEVIVVADGNNKQAAVFEMTATAIGVRELSNGVVYATNHFIAPETQDLDADPASSSSLLRLARLDQLVPENGEDSLYGEIDPEIMVSILRDRVNPYTGEESPPDTFENDESIATNGAIYQIVFDPEKLFFWVAAGEIPVPQQPFVGFSLGELLGYENAQPVTPGEIP